jgi:hypothetical protein
MTIADYLTTPPPSDPGAVIVPPWPIAQSLRDATAVAVLASLMRKFGASEETKTGRGRG